ncbi:MAG: hypothetical protein JRJ00_06025 [Deltaproteobacteria bacterium]|nr:hypothetical protein [Deltaproteobacteria bacterium]
MDVKKTVKEYYGGEIQKTSDLKTDACCVSDSVPDYIGNRVWYGKGLLCYVKAGGGKRVCAWYRHD